MCCGACISVITWIEVLVGCREGEREQVEGWLESFRRWPFDDAIAGQSVGLRQRHCLKAPDAIILATARCAGLSLATRNDRDFPLELGVSCIPTGSEIEAPAAPGHQPNSQQPQANSQG